MQQKYVVTKWLARWLPDALMFRIRVWRTRSKVRAADWSVEPDLPVLRVCASEGATVVDVGANVGLYSKFLAELVGRSGTVLAIEPVSSTFQIMSGNLVNYPQVRPLNVAVSSVDGEVEMVVPLRPEGHENYYRAHIREGQGHDGEEGLRTLKVRTITLDQLFEQHPRISFVKVDAEGHELSVFGGAGKLLGSRQASWLVEAPGDPSDLSTVTGKTFAVFAEHGYAAYRWAGSGLVEARPSDRSTNYLFRPAVP